MSRFPVKRCAGALLCLLLVACSSAGPSYNYRALPDPTQEPYRVRPGDVIDVRVLRNDTTSGQYVVRPDGYISMPLGGEIKVLGLTTPEIRERLVARLGKYVDDAQSLVSVSLSEIRGISYAVIGEITRPGSFESRRYVTILEALAQAGGLTPYAHPGEVYVLRKTGEGQLRIPVGYRELVRNPSRNRNFYLLSGDIVVVP